MTKPPSPPVPQGLQEMLKDYPELIQRLQENLTYIVEKPSPVTPPFERAIWMLEDSLGLFISEARAELRETQENGTAEEIADAKKKLNLMLDCRSPTSWGERNLADYFASQGMGARHVQ